VFHHSPDIEGCGAGVHADGFAAHIATVCLYKYFILFEIAEIDLFKIELSFSWREMMCYNCFAAFSTLLTFFCLCST
jgi:hypothetical protein